MSKAEKLLARMLRLPNDFTWDELTTVLEANGFELYKGSGSGRKWIHADGIAITMHEPHPGKILKRYQLLAAIDGLRQIGAIE